MKLKKALKLIKANCSNENCWVGKCPLAVPYEEHENCIDCLLSSYYIRNWDIDDINKRIKSLIPNRKALERGVLPSSVRLRETMEESIKNTLRGTLGGE